MRLNDYSEHLLVEAKDYLALLLSHEALGKEMDLDFAYALLDRLTAAIGEDE